jgi:hypothetical protein
LSHNKVVLLKNDLYQNEVRFKSNYLRKTLKDKLKTQIMNRLPFGDDIKGFLVSLIFFLLGMGTLLPVFLILIFLGASLAEEKQEVLPQPEPKIEEYQLPANQPFAKSSEQDVFYLKA